MFQGTLLVLELERSLVLSSLNDIRSFLRFVCEKHDLKDIFNLWCGIFLFKLENFKLIKLLLLSVQQTSPDVSRDSTRCFKLEHLT